MLDDERKRGQRGEKLSMHAESINDLANHKKRDGERDALWNSSYRYRMPARISRVLGRKTAPVPPSSGRYLRSTGAAKHRRRYIIRRALISPGSLLSRWTSGVPIEQCLARDVPCPQEIVARLLRTATRFTPLKFLHEAHAILKVRATRTRTNFSTRGTSTLYLRAPSAGDEKIIQRSSQKSNRETQLTFENSRRNKNSLAS